MGSLPTSARPEPAGRAPSAAAGRSLLILACVAVAFAAADTYVVVLALQDMVSGTGGDVTQLQRAAPIVSGFLLGYVAVLPLIGRIADLRGRLPVLIASLVVFALGSVITAAAYDLPSLVTGRVLQGVGAGGLVPATLALVADVYPVERRGVPLGVVSAVQEIGSVLGPILGALILAVSSWRVIFVANVVVAVILASALAWLGRRHSPTLAPSSLDPTPSGAATRRGGAAHVASSLLGWLGLVVAVVAAAMVFAQPQAVRDDLVWGALFVPFVHGAPDGLARWLTPVGAIAVAGLLIVVSIGALTDRPVAVRSWWRTARSADLPGAAWLAVALGGIVLAFATADPKIEVFSSHGRAYLAVAAIAGVGFGVHQRRAVKPLVPRAAFAARAAWGSLLVSLLTGAALIAALVDVPLFARTTRYPDQPVAGALVLLRFLVAVPVGAVLGGYLVRRLTPGWIVAAGMACSTTGFALMTRWDATALNSPAATGVLLLTGLGFGLALAPVNAAMLAATDAGIHGLAGALVVVARTIGMLVGISALTALGLRRFYAEQATMPDLATICHGSTSCPEFNALLRDAAIAQEQTVFGAAAVCAALAGVAAVVLLGRLTVSDTSLTDSSAR